MKFIKSSLNHPIVTVVITLAVVIAGIHAFMKMPRTEDPSITIRTGLVFAVYPGATSEEVERRLTVKLEEHIFKFPEIRKGKTYSTSRPGLAVINVELEDYVTEADLFWAKLRNELTEARSEFPEGVAGVSVNSDFGDTVAMLIAVHGRKYGYRELSDYADKIKDGLRSVREVGKLAVYGRQQEQITVSTDSERLSAYAADPMKIARALKERNVTGFSGSFESAENKIPIKTGGFFSAEDDVRNTLIDVSRTTGHPIYLKDVADVQRVYEDPSFMVRYDGEAALLLSVEMQEGKNIVELGESIGRVFTELKSILPPDLSLDLVADQPTVVRERMSTLTHEFMLAIASVILVTIILLPIRVAVIAAVAIPVTLCATLGLMNTFEIALHQVSIASLIMVLGIVVDDAIVIADNYVELLDRKVPKEDTAWRSAGDVFVPVLTATLTIIFSFLPLLILTGSVGEFISALPKTVSIALSVSFIVAVMLTPIMCRFFIKKGLHDETAGRKRKRTVLDRVQNAYAVTISIFMKRKYLAAVVGISAVLLGGLYFRYVPQQFFPSAERNQFVIDVWMPQGSRIETTDDIMRRIEKALGSRKDISHFASFAGRSAPRFYYNVNPQQPDPAYGQFIVNTASEEATSALVYELRRTLAETAPEALVIVKELQQGNLLEAPVEVRISGYDIQELKRIGAEISGIISAVPYSDFVHTDFFNDSMMIDVDVDTDAAARLGIPASAIAGYLYGGFDGLSVTDYREGERVIPVVLRLNEENRKSFSDIGDYYITSPLTGAKVPVRSVAELKPELQASRIVRRNGVPTLTVRAFVKEGYYASALLGDVRPAVEAIKLPAGYKISYGGELLNREETFPQMVVALGISLAAIFFVLLVQFKNIREPLVVMSSIPLALPGAMFGLFITNNPFGFTAFMGLISLCGIVVRNAIILVDYIKEKTAEGHSLERAATEAGERRLRPIFLTTMAAAVGVTPMILSGSSLWSPLASVIAVGLVFSMFFTLLVVPVLYVVVMSRKGRTSTAAVLVLLLFAGTANAETFTLKQAEEYALKNSRNLKITEAKIQEQAAAKLTARADYFPMLSVESMYTQTSNNGVVTIDKGALGTVPGLGGFPTEDLEIDQGSNSLFIVSTTLKQPLTQLFKINEGAGAADADLKKAGAEQRKAVNETAFAVRQLYYGILLAEQQSAVYRVYVGAFEHAVMEARDAFNAGNVLESAVMEAETGLLNSRQNVIAAETRLSDLRAQFRDLLNLPKDTEIVLSDTFDDEPENVNITSAEAYLTSPDVQAAEYALKKTMHARSAAKDEYIPDLGLFVRHTYQDGVPFVDSSITTFGVQAEWNVFDWGKRKGLVGQRNAQVTQASENLRNVRGRLDVELNRLSGRLEYAAGALKTAEKAAELGMESFRQMKDRLRAGLVSESKYMQAGAAAEKALYDMRAARLNLLLTAAELRKTAGVLVLAN
ncbi:AcrB/AcrD/AcrF family protein [Geovibrio thiophilus]|uniref:AcrB/AcrD/AcrF family protein n=1 Tax=Geovibrio thiophilus TaxID=139438 RepID=A0A410K052_9BACT|nr:efflux RND transporter permease subunit [Geovibrio thiophilus]QAR33685.1 AcrB/AcrD/AcrF family protein [Geovibrio thiophilus]